jgi:ABC-2 type transport system permease protein
MLQTIIKKEVLGLVMTLRFTVAVPLAFVLGTTSTLVLVAEYREGRQDFWNRQRAHHEEVQRLEDYDSLIKSGLTVDRPPAPLSWLVHGLERGVATSVYISIYDYPALRVDSGGNPLFYLFRPMDYAAVLWIVFSLMALFFSFDLISGEKERGTLVVCLSQPVSRSLWLIGKYVGALVGLLVAFAVSFLTILLIISVGDLVSLDHEAWLRVLAVAMISVLYIGFFVGVGLVVSAVTRKPVVSLLLALLVWLLVLFVIPYAATSVALWIKTVPQAAEIEAQIDQLRQEQSRQIMFNIAAEQRARGRVLDEETISQIVDRTIESITQQEGRIREEAEQRIASQINFMLALTCISPAEAFRQGLVRLANTGYHQQAEFVKQSRVFRSLLVNALLTVSNKKARLDEASLPRFIYRPESFKRSLQATLGNAAVLLAGNLFLWLAGLWSFARYDPR